MSVLGSRIWVWTMTVLGEWCLCRRFESHREAPSDQPPAVEWRNTSRPIVTWRHMDPLITKSVGSLSWAWCNSTYGFLCLMHDWVNSACDPPTSFPWDSSCSSSRLLIKCLEIHMTHTSDKARGLSLKYVQFSYYLYKQSLSERGQWGPESQLVIVSYTIWIVPQNNVFQVTW